MNKADLRTSGILYSFLFSIAIIFVLWYYVIRFWGGKSLPTFPQGERWQVARCRTGPQTGARL